MIRHVLIAIALLPWLVSSAAAQVKGPVIVSADVAPGKWKAVRLRNLPKDAVVAVRVRSTGEVMVAFLDAEDYKHFPAVTRPLYNGRVEKQIALALRMPATGDYFVVLDNRLGTEARTVTVTIRAARGTQKDETKNKPMVFVPDGCHPSLIGPPRTIAHCRWEVPWELLLKQVEFSASVVQLGPIFRAIPT